MRQRGLPVFRGANPAGASGEPRRPPGLGILGRTDYQSPIPHMRFLPLLAAVLVAMPAWAQQADHITDPQTAEPLPLATDAPPAPELRGDDASELPLLARMPAGATKAVRFLNEHTIIFQDGAAIVTAEFSPMRGGDGWVGVLDRIVLERQPSDLFLADDGLVFVALRQGGFVVIDASNHSSLTHLGGADGFDGLAVVVQNDVAYVGAGTSGMRVFDVSDPGQPQQLTSFATAGSANGLHIDGTTLFVANGASGFRTYDVSDPADPQLLATLDTESFVTNVVTRDGRAYLSGAHGLLLVDITDPSDPSILDSFPAGGSTTYEVAVAGDRLVVAGLAGFFSVDISDPDALQEEGSYPIAGQGLGVGISPSGERGILGDRFNGARILSLADPAEITQIAMHRNGGFSHKLAFEGDLLYVSDLAGGLRIYDLSNVHDGAAIMQSHIETPSDAQWLLVEDGIVFIADAGFDGTGLVVIDATTPHLPEIVGDWNSDNQAFGLDKAGDVLFLANGFSGVVALDVSDVTSIQELGSLPLGSNVVDVAVRGDVAFATSFGGGMIAIDVSDPANMALLSQQVGWGFLNAVDLPEPGLFAGDLAFVADGQLGLRVVDVSDPEELVSVATFPTASQARDVASGAADSGPAMVYVADDFFGIRAYAEGAEEVAAVQSSDRGIGVAASGDLVALAAGETGVYVFAAPGPTSAEDAVAGRELALSSVYPNPLARAATVRFTLGTAGPAEVAVYDLLGRRVARLAGGHLPAGEHHVRLDAAALASGVYVVRLSAGGEVATRRWLLAAITAFFHLVNKAEQLEIARINRERAAGATADAPRAESIAEAFHRSARRASRPEAVRERLAGLDVQPTLTAHPTEARRRTVLHKQAEAAALLAALQDEGLPAAEAERLRERLYEQVALLLATDEVRADRPSVREEVGFMLHFVADTVWATLPRITDDLERAAATYFDLPPEAASPRAVRFRSWVGGDRDGNPGVTPEVTRQTLRQHRRAALRLYARDLGRLWQDLSVSDRHRPAPEALRASIEADLAEGLLSEAEILPHRDEPFRVKVAAMRARVAARAPGGPALPRRAAPPGPRPPRRGAGGHRPRRPRPDGPARPAPRPRRGLRPPPRRARPPPAQPPPRGRRRRAPPGGGGRGDYLALREPERLALLARELENPRPLAPPGAPLSEETEHVVGPLRVAAAADPEALGGYVISMTDSVSDVFEVLLLAKEAGLWRMEGDTVHSRLDVAPLLETIDDLEGAGPSSTPSSRTPSTAATSPRAAASRR
jgi:hypothetical protein